MPIPSSEHHRLTRSQARLGSRRAAGLAASPVPTRESSSSCNLDLASGETESGSKAVDAGEGRRIVLGDLAGNDSPVVGLIPGLHNRAARTPFSILKSANGTHSCTKKSLRRADDPSNSTPIGENLLRSQVQLLLQKVESDGPAIHQPAPSLRALCHLQNFIDSPALKLLAPTPMNTPCNNNTATSEHVPTASVSLAETSATDLVEQRFESKPHTSGLTQNQGQTFLVQLPSSVSFQDKLRLQEEQNISPEADAGDPSIQHFPLLPKTSENAQITITESVNSGRDHQIMQISPLISEVMNKADILTLGKKTTRILKFESPDKSSAMEISCSSMTALRESFSSSVREFEEDEASEWSVLVNVSSPEAKHDEPDLDGEDTVDSGNSFCEEACNSSVHEHVQKNRIGGSKLDLLWSVPRKGTPFRKRTIEDDEEEEEEEEACDAFYNPQEEQVDSIWSGDSEQYTECENLSQHFSAFSVEAKQGERKGLPRGEGKHIRFSYDSDDEDMPPTYQEVQGICHQGGSAESALLLQGGILPVVTSVHLQFGEEPSLELEGAKGEENV